MQFVISHRDGWSSPCLIIGSDFIALVLMTGPGFVELFWRVDVSRMIIGDNNFLLFIDIAW